MGEIRSDEHNSRSYFSKAYDRAIEGLDGFKPEDIIPAPFTILVRVVPPDTMTKGGLHLPDMAQKEKGIAVVMALPENVCLMATRFEKAEGTPLCPWELGDVVLYSRNAGEALSDDADADGEYILMGWNPEDCTSDILGKIKSGGAERLKKWLDSQDGDS